MNYEAIKKVILFENINKLNYFTPIFWPEKFLVERPFTGLPLAHSILDLVLLLFSKFQQYSFFYL